LLSNPDEGALIWQKIVKFSQKYHDKYILFLTSILMMFFFLLFSKDFLARHAEACSQIFLVSIL